MSGLDLLRDVRVDGATGRHDPGPDSEGRSRAGGDRASGGETGDGDDEDPREVTRRPAQVGGALAVATGAVVCLLAAGADPLALLPAGVGLVGLGAGVARGPRWVVDAGGLGLLTGTAVAGLRAAEPVVLACAVGSVVAWDAGTNAVEVGDQLGREARATRPQVVHWAATLLVGTVTAGGSYLLYRLATGGQPVAALFFLLVAVLAIVSALRV